MGLASHRNEECTAWKGRSLERASSGSSSAFLLWAVSSISTKADEVGRRLLRLAKTDKMRAGKLGYLSGSMSQIKDGLNNDFLWHLT